MKDSQKLKELDGALLEMLEIKKHARYRAVALWCATFGTFTEGRRCFRRNWLSMNIC